MKFLHLADLHLGRSFPYELEKHRQQGRENRFKLFERAIHFCNENEVDYLMLAGDIVEEDLFTRSDLHRLMHGFNQLDGTEVFYLFGNHDFRWGRYLMETMDLPVHLHLFSSDHMSYFDDEKRRIRLLGQSWDEGKYKESLRLKPSDFRDGFNHILIHHGNWNAPDYFSLDARDPLLKRVDYLAMGHNHRPFTDGVVHMPGTPEPLDFGDLHQGYAVLGHYDGTWNFTPVPLSHRQILSRSIDLMGQPAMTEVVRQLKDGGDAESIYYITWTGALEDPHYLQALEDYLRRLEIEFKSVDETKRDINLEALMYEHEDDLLGNFLNFMNQHRDLENYEEILELGVEALLGDTYD